MRITYREKETDPNMMEDATAVKEIIVESNTAPMDPDQKCRIALNINWSIAAVIGLSIVFSTLSSCA